MERIKDLKNEISENQETTLTCPPKPAQQKIFNLFHQAHEGSKGEGIGLAIVQKIVSRHRGKVWVESEPDKGSKFYVSLPVEELNNPG